MMGQAGGTRGFRVNAVLAGILFIVATGATMLSQILAGPILEAPRVAASIAEHAPRFLLGIVLEVANALASAGIAIALYPVLRRCAETAAIAYVGLRVIEAGLGIVAAIGFLILVTIGRLGMAGSGWDSIATAAHDWAFLLVLIVFSLSTMFLYPVLFRFRLVPVVLSIWGLIGGLMLLASSLLILFGQISIGTIVDTALSLPIWVNEMALALWLIAKGFDSAALAHFGNEGKRS